MRSAERGMTLIEVMMALSVIVTAIMSLLTLIPATMRLINDSNEYEIARCEIEMKIAEIRAVGPPADLSAESFSVDGLTKPADTTECGSVTYVQGGLPVPDGTALPVGEIVPVGTDLVQVRIDWRGMDKIHKHIMISTLIEGQ